MSSRVTAGMIWAMVADALNWTTTEDKARLHDPTTMAYWDLCELAPFTLLRRQKALSFSGSAIQLPSDTIDVYAVEDSSNNQYRQINIEDLASTHGRKRWYYQPVTDGTDLTGSPFLQIVGSNGTPESETATVYYWVYPPALDEDSDLVLLPSSQALVIRATQYMMSIIDHDAETGDRLANQYDAAKTELLAKLSLPARFSGGKR